MSAVSAVRINIPASRVVNGQTEQVRAQLEWDPLDPLAAYLMLDRHVWVTSRDVLRDGIIGRTSISDVHVVNRGGYTQIRRDCVERTGQVTVIYRLATSDLVRFLKATEDELPIDATPVDVADDIDDLLADVLGGAR